MDGEFIFDTRESSFLTSVESIQTQNEVKVKALVVEIEDPTPKQGWDFGYVFPFFGRKARRRMVSAMRREPATIQTNRTVSTL